MSYTIENRICSDSHQKDYQVTYDGGSAGIQKILLCKECYKKPAFQKFVIKVEKVL